MISALGVIELGASIAPIINDQHRQSQSIQRHFSSFPMTGHLHNPALRLVSLNPLLSISFMFQRVPEVHEGFEHKLFISRTTCVSDAIQAVSEELGLTKHMPI